MQDAPDWFVLSGGGARGAFQLGALDVLVREHGWEPRGLAGISVGALFAADLAQAPPGRMAERVEALAHVLLDELPRRTISVLGLPARTFAGRRAVVRALLRDRLDPAAIRAAGRSFVGGAVDLRSGRFVTVTEAALTAEHLLGMITLPFLDRPVQIGDQRWVDGVLRRVVPLEAVLARDPRHVVLVTAGAPAFAPGGAGWRRTVQVAVHELVLLKEIRAAITVRRFGGPRIEVLAPTERLPHPLRFDAASLRASFRHGQNVARDGAWRWIDGPPPPAYAPYFA